MVRIPTLTNAEAANFAIAGGAGITSYATNTPPGSPVANESHITGPAPTGAWSAHPNKIASFIGGAWVFIPSGAIGLSHRGLRIEHLTEEAYYRWTGTIWKRDTSAFGDIEDLPTTLAGYGIGDAAPIDHDHVAADVTNFSAASLAVILAGLSLGSSAVITDADSFLGAFGKLQAQISLKLNASAVSAWGLTLIDDVDATAAKSTLGMGNVDNTSDANKPVSTATQTALNLKANLASPPLSGTPTSPTATLGTNTTQIASTAFVKAAVDAAIGTLLGTAPGVLDTLGELADALADDAAFSATMTTALAGKQPLNSNLTTVGGLTPTTDNIIQSKSGAWASRTPAQFKVDLALVKGDVGLGSVDNTSDLSKPISTATQTALDGKQPLNSNLTTIAGLAAATDSFMQAKGSAWAARTIAQVKADLGLTGTNSGDQTITLTGDVTGSGVGSFPATIANGAVTGAKMAGFTVAPENLLYGDSTNLIDNGTFSQGAANWTLLNGTTIVLDATHDYITDNYTAKIAAGTYSAFVTFLQTKRYFHVEPGRKYLLRGIAKSEVTGADANAIRVIVAFYDGDKTYVTAYTGLYWSETETSYVEKTVEVTVPANCAYCIVVCQINSTPALTIPNFWIAQLGFYRKVGTDLLEDASVTSAKLVDASVTDAKLRDGTALSVVGRSANSVGDVADIASAADHDVLRRSGTALGFGQLHNYSLLSGDDPANCVINANLERGDQGWSKAVGTTIENDSANARSGNYVMKHATLTGGLVYTINNQHNSVYPGEMVYAESWVKTSADAVLVYLHTQVWWYDKDKVFISAVSGNNFSTVQLTYVKSFLITAAPANAAYFRVIVAVQKTVGNAWSDDFWAFKIRKSILPPGSTSEAPLKFQSGTNLTTPEIGANEFDGTAYFKTVDVTSGRSQDASYHTFRLTVNGSAIGPTIADVFGSNSAFPTVLNGVYEIEIELWFLKTTAGTVTFTLTHTQTYTNLVADWEMCPATGLGTQGAMVKAGIVSNTTAAAALPASASLTDAANFKVVIKATMECGTAGNVRLRATSSAGTITPLRGSKFKARRLYAGNVGTYAA